MKGEVHGYLTSTILVTLSLQLSDIQSVANTFSSKCKGSVDGKLPKKSTIHTTGSPELVELPWPATIEMKTESQQILSCKPSGKCEYASLMLLAMHPLYHHQPGFPGFPAPWVVLEGPTCQTHRWQEPTWSDLASPMLRILTLLVGLSPQIQCQVDLIGWGYNFKVTSHVFVFCAGSTHDKQQLQSQ